jgi:hypothetical protein
MYGHKIYLELSDFINNSLYPVEAPAYSCQKHKVMESGELEPFYIPDKNEMVLTRVTIADMITMCNDVIPFKIIDSKDIVEIYAYLDEYTRKLVNFQDNKEAADYLVKATRFRDKLQLSMNILSKQDPVIAKMLANNTLMDMFKLKTNATS